MDPENKFQYVPIAGRKIRVFSIAPCDPSNPDAFSISMRDRSLGERKSLAQAVIHHSTNLLHTGYASLFGYQHEDSEEDLPFIAISYVWGKEPQKRVSILCNERNLEITASLHGALQKLRQRGEKGLIWADAICINQGDDPEKSEQVRMMGDIYALAKWVFIWLGEKEPHDKEGWELIKLINRDYRINGRPRPIDHPDKIILTKVTQSQWDGLLAIINRPWFERVWVLQEFLQARKRIFQCGDFEIPERPLFRVCQCIGSNNQLKHAIQMRSSPESKGKDEGKDKAEDKEKKRVKGLFGPLLEFERGIEPGQISWYQLFLRARTFRSSQPLDRLFALVSLSNDTSAGVIEYGRKFNEVFEEFIINTVQNMLASPEPDEIFLLLSMVSEEDLLKSGTSDKGGTHIRASWVPHHEHDVSYCRISAIFSMKKSLTTVPEIDLPEVDSKEESKIEPKVLGIKGRAFDRVGKIFHDDMHTEPPVKTDDSKSTSVAGQTTLTAQVAQQRHTLAFYDRIQEHVSSMKLYPTGENLEDVFWRSLIFNTQTTHAKASPEMAGCLQSFREGKGLLAILSERRTKYINTSPADIYMEAGELVSGLRWKPSYQFRGDSSPATEGFWYEMAMYVKPLLTHLQRWANAAVLLTWGRQYFVSDLGYVGWLPGHAQEGDLIYVFNGSRFPFIVRPYTKPDQGTPQQAGFKLIGACYMHGIMEGEAMEVASKLNNGHEAYICLV